MKGCFGTIYPDFTQFQFGKEIAGKVFRLRIDTLGPGHRDRRFEADLPQWQDCQDCVEFESCYGFSNAKLAVQQAASAI
jgi:hypothetical protein